MAKVIEKTGKTVEEAIKVAVAELGVKESDLEIEILETPSKKFFGLLGETPAKIRATVKNIAPPVKVAEPARIEKIPVEEVAPVVEDKIPVEEPVEKFEPVLEPSPVEEVQTKSEPVDREKILDKAKNFLQEVFAVMELEVAIETAESEDGYTFNLSGKGLGILIGRHGQSLDALQYLTNLAANERGAEDKIYFILDVEDYRKRRAETLIKLAKGVAERAVKTRKDVRLEPMNRHERKIIHTALQDNDRVETHSAGTDPYRYVIVSPKRGRR